LRFHTIKGLQISSDEVIEFDQELVRLAGIWDLKMTGAEQIDVERRFQDLTDGPSVDLYSPVGTIVCGPDGLHCQLLSHFSDDAIADPEKPRKSRRDRANYYPADGLPEDCRLVVRTSALRDLEARLSEPDLLAEKPLEQRERTTLLVIIAALAELAKIDVTKPAKAGATIESQTALLGVEVSSRAIQNHLNRIPEALARRDK
jgi:hypothetical protein